MTLNGPCGGLTYEPPCLPRSQLSTWVHLPSLRTKAVFSTICEFVDLLPDHILRVQGAPG
jgi:hypothetical protein